MANILRRLRRRFILDLFRYPARYAPYTDWGDRFALWYWFFVQHDRFPTSKMIFNDVLYRLKTTDAIIRPDRVATSDKELVKEYAIPLIGAEHVVPTLAVLRSEADIDTYQFPAPCVVKPTQGCGGIHFLFPGDTPDRSLMKAQLAENYYFEHRERNYKTLKGKLIVEPMLFDGQPVNDYKVFCWRGEPRCILYANDRHRQLYRVLFDTDWTELPIPLSPELQDRPHPPRPDRLDEMLQAAATLSKPFDFVRVDFYADPDRVLLGEITHLHNGGNEQFASFEDELALSRHIFGSVDRKETV